MGGVEEEEEIQTRKGDAQFSSRRLPDLGIKSMGRLNEAREAGLEEERRQYTSTDILVSA